MNTDTPETFKSAMWSELGWSVDIDFARNLERERDEARAESIRWQSIAEGRGRTDECNDSDTPRTDHVVTKSDQKDAEMAFAIMTDHSDCLERELTTVTAQRDEAREEIIGWRNKWQVAVEMAALAENKLATVTAQRDRMAEALRRYAWPCSDAELAHHCASASPSFSVEAQREMKRRNALQSLTPKP
jgi:hypothetical protein